jgi:hypothetical protein
LLLRELREAADWEGGSSQLIKGMCVENNELSGPDAAKKWGLNAEVKIK